jgi:hypothetical protein
MLADVAGGPCGTPNDHNVHQRRRGKSPMHEVVVGTAKTQHVVASADR